MRNYRKTLGEGSSERGPLSAMRARVPGSVAWGLASRLPSVSRSFWEGPVGPGRAA